MQTRRRVRYLGWQSLTDLSKFTYGLVPISDHRERFFAVDGRTDLRAELSLIRALSTAELGGEATLSLDVNNVER